MLTLDMVKEIVAEIKVGMGWEVRAEEVGPGAIVIYIHAPNGIDENTGAPMPWDSRKWLIDANRDANEVVRTAFAAFKRALAHEAGEMFYYQGIRVYDPHFKPADEATWRKSLQHRSEDVRVLNGIVETGLPVEVPVQNIEIKPVVMTSELAKEEIKKLFADRSDPYFDKDHPDHESRRTHVSLLMNLAYPTKAD